MFISFIFKQLMKEYFYYCLTVVERYSVVVVIFKFCLIRCYK